MKLRIFLLISTLVFLGAEGAYAKGDKVAGKAKSAVCAACHNTDGNSVTAIWPKIAGQHEKYLVDQLKAYRMGPSGPRNEPAMYAIISNHSDQDFEDLAAYFASQTMSAGKTPNQFFALGQKIYRGGNPKSGVSACGACHGPQGNGNELANYPKLSGQQADYVMGELKNYRDGKRATDPNGMMRDIAARMTDAEIEAVAHYVAGLH